MFAFDPTNLSLKSGNKLHYSDGAEEVVIAVLDGKLLVRTPIKVGVINYFIYRAGVCYAHIWHAGLDDQTDAVLATGLERGDRDLLGDRLADTMTEANGTAAQWGGRAGAHKLAHLAVKMGVRDRSGRSTITDLKWTDLSLKVSEPGHAAVAPHCKKAVTYLARLSAVCPTVQTIDLTMSDSENDRHALAVSCPALAAPVILIYGPRQRDAALLNRIA